MEIKFNSSNMMTFSRILATPAICLFLLSNFKFKFLFSSLLFFAAIMTDYFDGKMARKRNIVTNFGKFFDPTADKILMFSILICFLSLKLINPWIIILMIIRDFLLTTIRTLLFQKEVVLPASKNGKIKTLLQCMGTFGIMILLSLTEEIFIYKNLNQYLFLFFVRISKNMLWLSVLLSIISLIEYIKSNIKHIKEIIWSD
ncbi:MAG: CDP-diacylglycerol--glycerol-3-phosphate 3-phosphatidyltransferase [Candidatus Improbicoccus pseudotrichonymphae]|uniref:CDP-diacylglycerol--glycerol-3-phosphate 3-phosphatidyltransferase n=1 Tax=Candidatus Improbicoccus pseudotrichonymphae TaxID=3033792 RepID=A0AA48HUV0_9FIRM|nr:MAG: CDP-diacylglycerol--glycerol-3-phosphate 3-phosphatidyltransferase [Candidatus Improbicoccus pseudotrichonymphae]